MRKRWLAPLVFGLFALLPWSALAATAQPVATASFAIESGDVEGSGCLDPNFGFDIHEGTATANAGLFGFSEGYADRIHGEPDSTFGTTRVYTTLFEMAESDLFDSDFQWESFGALKCLSNDVAQITFKGSDSSFYTGYISGNYVEGDMGSGSRLVFTVDLANAVATVKVYAPVVFNVS